MRSFVKRLGDIAESLLPGGVPDVEGNGLPVVLYSLDLEVDSDGRQIFVLERIVAVSNEQAGLADPTVAHHQVLQSRTFLFRHLLSYSNINSPASIAYKNKD